MPYKYKRFSPREIAKGFIGPDIEHDGERASVTFGFKEFTITIEGPDHSDKSRFTPQEVQEAKEASKDFFLFIADALAEKE